VHPTVIRCDKNKSAKSIFLGQFKNQTKITKNHNIVNIYYVFVYLAITNYIIRALFQRWMATVSKSNFFKKKGIRVVVNKNTQTKTYYGSNIKHNKNIKTHFISIQTQQTTTETNQKNKHALKNTTNVRFS
jgi:hypothetical protein